MRILLLHSQDQALVGPWNGQRWDAVFDLGRGGWAACERWAQAFGCPVRPIDELRRDSSQIRRVREVLRFGMGRLIDREDLDWWELTSLLIHQQLETLVLLTRLAKEFSSDAQVFITRDGFEARILRLLLADRLHVIDSKPAAARKGAAHYADRLRRLTTPQILDILGDKYDGDYRLRRHWHRRRRQTKPVVLLPSAYVNVSLLGTAYARVLPDTAFLLVSTRRSGRLRTTPPNVQQEWLASYAGESCAKERREILDRWGQMQQQISDSAELATLRQLGLMDDFPRLFAEGLCVRDAWKRVLDEASIKAVFCGDDSNPYTHIPLLLARKRGLPTISCHHGAFDGRYLIKRNYADVILAKGRMEWDYLVNVCGLDPAEVEIGAPSVPKEWSEDRHPQLALPPKTGNSIIFFSEPYEISVGRAEEIYRDILPGLLALAARCGKKLVVKLHPSESLHDRQTLAVKLLAPDKSAEIAWSTGTLSKELLQSAWFGITAQSSVALECVVHGVPCFLCEWLDLWPYGYVAQYRKFGVGIGLNAPQEIANIPELLAGHRPSRNAAEDCWQAISPQRFEELLSGHTAKSSRMTLEMQRVE